MIWVWKFHCAFVGSFEIFWSFILCLLCLLPGWVATAADSAMSYPDVDLGEKEWCDYDENQVGVNVVLPHIIRSAFSSSVKN